MADPQHALPPPPAIVFTDLDGTLLDHSSYSHAAADDALARLRAAGIPCVLTTSKTRAEVLELRRELRNSDPFIVENGSAVFIEGDHVFDSTGLEHSEGLHVHRLGRPRARILEQLNASPARTDFQWRGFADMDVTEIAQRTGLSTAAAQAASWREYCEPIVWLDDPSKLDAFAQLLTTLDLCCVRGGRFVHILDSRADKGAALKWLCSRLPSGTAPVTIALGDSDNDAGMLRAADIAVLVRSPHHPFPSAAGRRSTRQTQGVGPAGWAEAVHAILDDLHQD